MAEKYDIYFQDESFGRIGFDGKSIHVISAQDGHVELVKSFLADLRRDTGKTDKEVWETLPYRVNGRLHVRNVTEEGASHAD